MSAEAVPDAALGADVGHPQPQLPFFFRWVVDAPVSPWWLAVGVAGLYLVLLLVAGNALGFFEGFHHRGTPIWSSWVGALHVYYSVWLAWIPLAIFHLVRGAERDLAALAPALDTGGRSLESLRAEVLSVSPRALLISAGAGVLLAGLVFALMGLAGDEMLPRGFMEWSVSVSREIIANVMTTLVLGWGLAVAARLSKLVRERARISVLEVGRLAPLTRNGTRLAFFWILLLAIGLPGFAFPCGESFLAALAIVTFVAAALSAIAVVVPLRGARRLLAEQKAEELARVRRAIESAREAVLGAPSSEAGTRAGARLPGLLAWEARVEGVPEWLLDLGALRRLAFYLLIPLASWVAAAFVERMVDSALA